MTFGNPLGAGPWVFAPATAPLVQQLVGAADVGPIDVGAYQAVLVQLTPDVAQSATLKLAWKTAAGETPNPDTVPSGNPTPITTRLRADSAQGELVVVVPVLAPALTFHPTARAGTPTLTVYGSSTPFGNRVWSPGLEGAQLQANADALGIGGAIVHTIDTPGAGPTRVVAKGSGGTPFSIAIETVIGARVLAGNLAVVPAAGSLGILSWSDYTVWLPPEPCQFRVTNGGTAQTVTTTITGAALAP